MTVADKAYLYACRFEGNILMAHAGQITLFHFPQTKLIG